MARLAASADARPPVRTFDDAEHFQSAPARQGKEREQAIFPIGIDRVAVLAN